MSALSFIHGGDWGVDDGLVVHAQFALGSIPFAYVIGQGCADHEQVKKNLLAVLSMYQPLEQSQVVHPRYGAMSTPPKVERFFGDDGMNNCIVEQGGSRRFTTSRLDLRMVDEFEWLETGPTTNLAHSMLLNHDGFLQKLKRIVLMAGAFEVSGLVGSEDAVKGGKTAEFNVYQDPQSLHVVLRKAEEFKIPVVFASWDECSKVRLLKRNIEVAVAKDRASRFMLNMVRQFFVLYPTDNIPDQEEVCYAPADLVAFAALNRLYGVEEDIWASVETRGLEFGKTNKRSFKEDRRELYFPAKYYRITEVDNLTQWIYSLMGWESMQA